MPVEPRLIETKIVELLAEIGVVATHVEVEILSINSFTVTIVSEAFEGRTFLDRELRVRPAVARAFGIAKAPRAEFVIEPLTPAETPNQSDHDEDLPSLTNENDESRQGRVEWRKDAHLVIDSLSSSHYIVSPIIENRVYIAERSQLASERLAIGFASSPRSTTVDLETRSQIQNLRASQMITESYYISPTKLESPFANQSHAPWLQLHTVSSFLHKLNSSDALSRRLMNDIVSSLATSAPEHRGTVIEPAIRLRDDTIQEREFFNYVESWRHTGSASLLVVMANAGHGKTTLTLELALRMAKRHLEAPTNPVALVVPFESVRRTVDFESLLYRRLGELRPGPVGGFLALLERGDGILIVDGFDELADDAGFEAAEAQIRSMKFLFRGRAKVILAGRAVFTQAFAGSKTVAERAKNLLGDISVDVIEILPFDERNIEEYVNTRIGLGAPERKNILAYCDASPDHTNLAANPLLLKFLCSLALSGTMPKGSDATSSVSSLLEKVCEREEERQQLGIGVRGQREFLHNLAEEIFSAGKPLLRDDVAVIASLVAAIYRPGQENDVCGRLVDHALLRQNSDNRIDFVHPLIRDVVLGEAMVQHLVGTHWSAFSRRDLPEGAISYLASQYTSTAIPLPRGWLSEPSTMPPTARRNFVRVATRAASQSTRGNGRDWVESAWTAGSVLRGMDLSDLRFKSLSFDDLKLQSCDLSQSLFEDCDFRDAVLDACVIKASVFLDCRVRTAVRGGVVADTIVATDHSGTTIAASAEQLHSALRGQSEALFEGPKSTDVRARVARLAQLFLSQLMDLNPPRFHTIPEDQLQSVGETDRELAAVSKVIQPRVLSKLCRVTVHGGSQRRVEIDDRHRQAVVNFMTTGHPSGGLQSLLGSMSARAARYLD